MSRRIGLFALFALFSLGTYSSVHAAEDTGSEPAAIEKAIKEMKSARKLTLEKVEKQSAATSAKILGLSPCSPPPVPAGDVLAEMTTELQVGQSEPADVLFIEYLFCIDESTGKLILKEAQSIPLPPGSGVCGWLTAHLNDLHPGKYTLIGRVSTSNPDGSETIRARKKCSFTVQ